MQFEWDGVITFLIIIIITIWVISKFKKQTMKDTIADIKDIVKGGEN